jgi:hypothetical protein
MENTKKYTMVLRSDEIAFIATAVSFFNDDYKDLIEPIKELAESIENKFSLNNICDYIQEKKD